MGGESRTIQANVFVIHHHSLTKFIDDVVGLHHAGDVELRQALCKVVSRFLESRPSIRLTIRYGLLTR